MKIQIPSSKLQGSSKHQAPNMGVALVDFDYWNLEFLWSLDVGAWNL